MKKVLIVLAIVMAATASLTVVNALSGKPSAFACDTDRC